MASSTRFFGYRSLIMCFLGSSGSGNFWRDVSRSTPPNDAWTGYGISQGGQNFANWDVPPLRTQDSRLHPRPHGWSCRRRERLLGVYKVQITQMCIWQRPEQISAQLWAEIGWPWGGTSPREKTSIRAESDREGSNGQLKTTIQLAASIKREEPQRHWIHSDPSSGLVKCYKSGEEIEGSAWEETNTNKHQRTPWQHSTMNRGTISR